MIDDLRSSSTYNMSSNCCCPIQIHLQRAERKEPVAYRIKELVCIYIYIYGVSAKNLSMLLPFVEYECVIIRLIMILCLLLLLMCGRVLLYIYVVISDELKF